MVAKVATAIAVVLAINCAPTTARKVISVKICFQQYFSFSLSSWTHSFIDPLQSDIHSITLL